MSAPPSQPLSTRAAAAWLAKALGVMLLATVVLLGVLAAVFHENVEALFASQPCPSGDVGDVRSQEPTAAERALKANALPPRAR